MDGLIAIPHVAATIGARVTIVIGMLAMLTMLGGCDAWGHASWRESSQAGIEKLRKRDVVLELRDAGGQPVAGAMVEVHQTRKAFAFGSAISAGILNNARWQTEFKKYFNTAVFENETKWYSNEGARGRVTYNSADQLLAWCDRNQIQVRGHCLFWEPAKWTPSWLPALPNDAIRQAVEGRLTSATTHFKGRFISWDVDNEMLHGSFYSEHLGKGIHAWMYKEAAKIDSKTPLFVNEFNILSIDQSYSETQTEQYVAQIRALMDEGAPIGGIGIQGHLWNEDILAHPEVIRRRLDRVASLGLPIWISEFDVADPDEHVRADKLELVYRLAYAHPAVQGIMMWVFWAGNSWRGPTAALMNQDWTPNEEGKRFAQLMDEWNTNATLSSDASGTCGFRGFYGDYSVTIKRPGQQATTRNFTLSTGGDAQHMTLEKL